MHVRVVVSATLLSLVIGGAVSCAPYRQPSRGATPGSETCEGTWILSISNPADYEYQVTAGDEVIAIVGRGMHSFAVSASTRAGQAIPKPWYRIQRVRSNLDPDRPTDRDFQIQSAPSARLHCAK